jgi:hypothetical protein
MLKLSLVALFLATMATFTIAAASLPVPPAEDGVAIQVADLG